jgi:hypothetical protein
MEGTIMGIILLILFGIPFALIMLVAFPWMGAWLILMAVLFVWMAKSGTQFGRAGVEAAKKKREEKERR